MTKNTFFLTEVAMDWPESNLRVLQSALLEAEKATLARSDVESDPLLGTPNLPNLRGYLRWCMVQKQLALASEQGKFCGITSEWVDLGGVCVLELRGPRTLLTACHIADPKDVPRESNYRKSLRVANQVCPFLKGFEPMSDQEEKIRLLLVHGGRKSSFAYIRAYVDPNNPAAHFQLSTNIMSMPILLPAIDVEMISEPVVNLKHSNKALALDGTAR